MSELLRPVEVRSLIKAHYGRACLLGTGHIGGSLVLALRHAGVLSQVTGFDRDAGHAQRARALGIVDEVAPSAVAAARAADLVLLAVPVRAIAGLVREIAPVLPRVCLLSDVGSTKAQLLADIEAHLPIAGRFIGGHPLAGLERSGPEAADPALFRGRPVFLTPTARSIPEAIEAAAALWIAAGAHPLQMEPAEHDAVVAAVSHLPHAIAYALVSAVASCGAETIGLASGGFRDTTRIASSNPVMWRDIFLENRAELLAALDRFGTHLAKLRHLVEAQDAQGLEQELGRIAEERRKIVG